MLALVTNHTAILTDYKESTRAIVEESKGCKGELKTLKEKVKEEKGNKMEAFGNQSSAIADFEKIKTLIREAGTNDTLKGQLIPLLMAQNETVGDAVTVAEAAQL